MAKKQVSNGDKKVIRLFYDGDKYKDPVFVGINGHTWLIKRGEDVEVPAEVAEVLENQARQDAHAAAYSRMLADNYQTIEKGE